MVGIVIAMLEYVMQHRIFRGKLKLEKMKKILSKDSTIIIGIILGIILLSIPYIVQTTIYNGVDTAYHMSRIVGMTNSWKEGNFLAFIHSDTSGYGYAIGFFYSNFFFIIPSILYLLGMNIVTIYKLFLVACTIFSAIAMYICTKRIAKSKYAAIIATILYTMCSYRIINMVLKSFVGEILSFIFIPIILLGLYEIIANDEKKWWIFAIGFIGILNSNLVMTEIMIAIAGIILLCNITRLLKNKARLKSLCKATIVSLLMTAVFWMPMLEQLSKSTFAMKDMIHVYQPYRWLLEFEDMFWGTAQYKSNYAAAYGLGIIYPIILLCRLRIKEKDKIIKYCDIAIVAGLLLLLCMTKAVPWKHLKTLGGMIQFLSRLEVVVAVFFSIACGIICSKLAKNSQKIQKVILIVICILEVIATVFCINSCIHALQKYQNVEQVEKIGEDFTYNICDGVYLPREAINPYMQYRIEKDAVTNNEELEYTIDKKGLKAKVEFTNNQSSNTYIELPMHYYYGYVAKSNVTKQNYKVEQGEEGLIRVYLAENIEDTIEIAYQTTQIQKIGGIITGLSIVISVVFILKNRRKVCQ